MIVVDKTPPAASGLPFSMTVWTFATVAVAHFTDLNPLGTATIDWGDGTTSAGTIVANPGGGYDVMGNHRYTSDGTQIATTTIYDAAGNATAVTSSGGVADLPLVFNGVSIIATEYQPFTDMAVAIASGPTALGSATADIDWGDNTAPTAGTLILNPATGEYSIGGSHTYTQEGAYTLSVTLHLAGAADSTVHSQALVDDAPLTLLSLSVVAQEGISTLTASYFNADPTETDPNDPNNLITASIAWGDGATTLGTITADPGNPGVFNVVGTHSYLDGPHAYTVELSLKDIAGPVAKGSVDVNVANVPPTTDVTGPALGVVNRPYTISILTDDPSPADREAGFSYTINWGDGKINTVQALPNNGLGASFSHAYAATGSFTVVVTASDKDGGIAADSLDLQVINPPVLKGVSINGGLKQRSHIDKIAFKISPVDASLTLSDLKLLRNYSAVVSLSRAVLTYDPATGAVVLDLTRVTLPDGDYQLQVPAAANTTLTVNFHRLAGDVQRQPHGRCGG